MNSSRAGKALQQRPRLYRHVVLGAALCCGLLSLAVQGPAGAATSGKPSSWLTAVSGSWAVGAAGRRKEALILHLEGSTWKREPLPALPGLSELNGVSGSWAVGLTTPSDIITAPTRTLILHWNGQRWVRVPSPSFGRKSQLNAVYGSWAVGEIDERNNALSLVLHWNGTAWVRVESADPEPASILKAVSGDLAVGVATNFRVAAMTLALRWNGKAWVNAPLPKSVPLGALYAVSNGVAVGYSGSIPSGRMQQLIVRLGTGGWRRQGLGVVHSRAGLYGLSKQWAVGIVYPPSRPGRPLILRRTAQGWSQVPAPCPSVAGALTGVSGNWAVGSSGPSSPSASNSRALIEHWNGSAWKVVPLTL